MSARWRYFRLLAAAQACLLRASVRRRLTRARFRVTGRLENARFVALAWVLNRFAPPSMRHAALLLGYEMGLGRATEDLLFGPLHEFTRGSEYAEMVRFGDADERHAGIEGLRLEQALYKPPSRRRMHLLRKGDAS